MIPATYRAMMERLAQRTVAGEVNWQPTAVENVVAVHFRDFSLTMRKDFDSHANEEFVRWEIINQEGKEVDGFFVSDDEEQWNSALELFDMARRRAHKLDDAVNQIVQELNKEGPVGRDARIPEREPARDDLPF